MTQPQPQRPPADTGTATLHGYGRITWPTLAQALNGLDAAWADYDGFHIATTPTQPPPYTHLWAWSTHWSIRARIDQDHTIVAALHLHGNDPPPLTPILTETVRYTRIHTSTWPAGEQRIGPLPAALADRKFQLDCIEGPRPITFVRLL
jgi:hypothetical protein